MKITAMLFFSLMTRMATAEPCNLSYPGTIVPGDIYGCTGFVTSDVLYDGVACASPCCAGNGNIFHPLPEGCANSDDTLVMTGPTCGWIGEMVNWRCYTCAPGWTRCNNDNDGEHCAALLRQPGKCNTKLRYEAPNYDHSSEYTTCCKADEPTPAPTIKAVEPTPAPTIKAVEPTPAPTIKASSWSGDGAGDGDGPSSGGDYIPGNDGQLTSGDWIAISWGILIALVWIYAIFATCRERCKKNKERDTPYTKLQRRMEAYGATRGSDPCAVFDALENPCDERAVIMCDTCSKNVCLRHSKLVKGKVWCKPCLDARRRKIVIWYICMHVIAGGGIYGGYKISAGAW